MRPIVLVAASLLLAGCLGGGDAPRLPDGIAVLGDSISRATNARGDAFGEHPAHAWATGTNASDGVESHYERLRASLNGTM
ncbi:MAG TPA: hypothetical protein VM582_03715, partial [Candidatus Thermoplasmatota archaeon]|nr:hypothetical protein [Candidatus Thermoplasmatota archaeon]